MDTLQSEQTNTTSRYAHFLILLLFSFTLTMCGTSSDGGDASLDGDLSFEVEASSGIDVIISTTTYDGDDVNFETSQTIRFAEGGGVESDDLKDGDYEGYQLQASVVGGGPADLTLRLLSNGEVLGETSETTSQEGNYVVEVGTFPEL